MNVLLVSECGKAALVETRRILDQFAERKGERTWATSITQQGLSTVRALLRKSARKNTAVACHWIKSGNRSELLWIVGSVRAFNRYGSVPTNITTRNVLRKGEEDTWITGEAIALLGTLAGLFHDFGKANVLFQEKLSGKRARLQEPCRHEWVSLRMFQAFVQGDEDRLWLQRLLDGDGESLEKNLLSQLQRDQKTIILANPFSLSAIKSGDHLPLRGPIARAVGWLIISHHRLLVLPIGQKDDPPELSKTGQWISTPKPIRVSWNSPQFDSAHFKPDEYLRLWTFPNGSPFLSNTWLERARRSAKRALGCQYFFERDWLNELFSIHLARLCLMFADHRYSADHAHEQWQDGRYTVYANTDQKSKKLKQRLDEHCIGVSRSAFLCAKSLPRVREELPSITRHKGFRQRSKDARFNWQDKAFDLAISLSRSTTVGGFFGINMASTGCGKTLANARIVGGLAGERGCRFTVALGLRTLTLQTGKALQERLTLADDDIAVIIGSTAVQELDAYHSQQVRSTAAEDSDLGESGSESAEPLFPEHQYVRYDGALYAGRLKDWFGRSDKLHKLVSAPVVVCTIDQLMPATESLRGGHQVAPMLRLLTSDLIIDEADDFSIEDLPALSRLVNWAGMLGSRILLSSATLPQSLVAGLFEAYREGWFAFRKATAVQDAQNAGVTCAWFDEYVNPKSVVANDESSFCRAHESFILERISCLEKQPSLRKGKIIPLSSGNQHDEATAVESMAQAILEGAYQLHQDHNQISPKSGQRISIGLVRFANINPLVKVVRTIIRKSPKSGFSVFFCVYHSQFPLVVRSSIEARLDRILMRKESNTLWSHTEISAKLNETQDRDVLFIVFASPVAEVGRDHDYDWSVVEPSSLRSIIQLAGRVQRHRLKEPMTPNVLLLERNFKGLRQSDGPWFCRPGPEASSKRSDFRVGRPSLKDVLLSEQYKSISSIARIKSQPTLKTQENLGALEYERIKHDLNHDKITAWWKQNGSLYGELQRRTRFRASEPDETFCFYSEDESEKVTLHKLLENGVMKKVENSLVKPESSPCGNSMNPWFGAELCVHSQLTCLAQEMGVPFEAVCRRFGEIRLRDRVTVWGYDLVLGFYSWEEGKN